MSSELDRRFSYHPPRSERRRTEHETVRSICREAAEQLEVLLPPGREAALVITKLEEAMFWANAALARSPDSEDMT